MASYMSKQEMKKFLDKLEKDPSKLTEKFEIPLHEEEFELAEKLRKKLSEEVGEELTIRKFILLMLEEDRLYSNKD